MTTQVVASKSRVPAYGLSDSGAPVTSVSSRIAWMKRKGFGKAAHRKAEIDRRQESAKTERDWVRRNIEQIGVDFDSPDFDLSMLKAAADHLLALHNDLRDVAAYLFLAEEEDFNRGVVRLPTPSAVRDDMDKLSPSNRRRALGMIEQLLEKQRRGHDAEDEQ